MGGGNRKVNLCFLGFLTCPVVSSMDLRADALIHLLDVCRFQGGVLQLKVR